MTAPRTSTERVLELALGALLVCTCLTGFAFSVQHATSAGLFSYELASEMLSAHSAFSTISVYVSALAVASVYGDTIGPSLHLVTCIVVVVGLVLACALLAMGERGFLDPGLATAAFPLIVHALRVVVGVVAIVVAARLQLALDDIPNAVTMSVFASGVLALLAGLGVGAQVPRVAFDLSVLASISALFTPRPGDTARAPLRLATFIAILFVVSVTLLPPKLADLYEVVPFLACALVGGGALRHVATALGGGLHAACGKLAILFFVQSALLRTLLGGEDSLLPDTLFATGQAHMQVFALVLAWLALWLRERMPRPSCERFVTIALITLGGALLLFTWTSVMLGANGHPRRYTSHVPTFDLLHGASIVGGAFVLLALTVLVALTQRKPAERPSVVEVFT